MRELLWWMRAQFAASNGVALSPPPRLASVSPTSGTQSGGTALTLRGNLLDSTVRVLVGGIDCTSVTRVNSTQCTAVTPAGAAGAADVTVVTLGGESTLAGAFTYAATAPTVTGVSPSTGSSLGGTAVTVTGTNFTGATSVTFGGVAATSVVVVNATTITCVTPAGSAGAATVAVTTPGGTGSLSASFTFVAVPTVTATSLAYGDTAGGYSMVITGTGFTGATSVTIGGASASFTVNNATTITATVPSGSAGAATVAVTTPGGTGSNGALFAFYSPSGSPNLQAWYRADVLTAAGSSLTTWTNQAPSGSNRNLAATAGAEPLVFSSDVNFNNRPTLGTTAGTDEVRSMGFGGAWSSSVAQPITIYMVLRLPASSANAVYWFIEPSGGVSGSTCFYGTSSATVTTDGANTLVATLTTDTTYVACLVFNGASSAVYLSRWNTTAASGSTGTNGTTGLFVGTGGGAPGRYRIAEIVHFGAAHNATQRQQNMQYLATRYAVAVTA